nr:hypothetical protein [Tanacetum cinerariifolium]
MDQNINYSGSDQIQTPQYPVIHPPSQEISDEVFQAKGDLMKSIQIFLEEFNYIPFGEKQKILLQAWDKFFAIQHAQSEDRPIFFDDNEDYFVQYKEYLENSSKEIAASNSNQEKEGPPQDFDIRQFIREECCIEVCEEQKQNMENTILELVKICQQKELYCMHDNSGVEELVPIPNECEVTSEDKRECDMLVCENSPICDDHYEIFSDSNNDDDISSDDNAFEDIEYVEASLPDLKIISVEEKLLSINHFIANIESLNDNPILDCVLNSSVSFPISEESDNSLSDKFSPEFKTFCNHTEERRSGSTTTHTDDSLPEYDSFCFETEPDQERLINVVKNDISDESTNYPFWKKSIYFLLLIIRYHRESDFANPSFPRPPPEPPDNEFDFKTDTGEEISVVMNDNGELECLDPRDEIDVSTNVDDYFLFLFVIRIFLPYLIYSEVFPLLLSAESEDTIFDPPISV